jgi:hypothetical protein
MKTTLIILIVICAVIGCGCTSAVAPAGISTTPATSDNPAIPNLTGSWTGPMQGYDEGSGFTDYPYLTMKIVIAEQHGRLFSGQILFVENDTRSSTDIAGVIGRDSRTFTFTEKGGGYNTGEIIAKDEIEVIYLQDGSPYHAALDTLKRI